MTNDHGLNLEDFVRPGVEAALELLYLRDSKLFGTNVNERSITHHLAKYLELSFPGWDVDAEYNRDAGSVDPRHVKKLQLPSNQTTSTDDINARTVFPDIIVHHRGTYENLLVIECKVAGRRDDGRDRKKLAAFTNPKGGGLGYEFGLRLVLALESAKRECEWWRQGNPLSNVPEVSG